MEEDYIYLVDLDDFLVCQNISNTCTVTSILPVHYHTYKSLHPIYYLDLEKLLYDLNESRVGFSTPRFGYITIANWHNNGLKIGLKDRFNNHIPYSQSEIERILRIAHLEIEFERIRRQINPLLPSRLSSIYLADNSIDGKTMLKNMFWNKKQNFLIEEVKINYACLIHRADYRWIEEYENDKREIFIENYWLGREYNSIPSFEYLLEGQIELQNQESIKLIRHKWNQDI